MSQTTFQRSFMAEPTNPSRPDLMFKHKYSKFCQTHSELHHWEFFLPLHEDDKHYLTSLHLPAKDNQADFDTQLLALTKLLIDSLNEKAISKEITNLAPGDKGITKLEKFLDEKRLSNYQHHIKFLRILQDLGSRSSAHRKGSSYDRLVKTLKIEDSGQKTVFGQLLTEGCHFLDYLLDCFCQKDK